jgi:hypothetical protein
VYQGVTADASDTDNLLYNKIVAVVAANLAADATYPIKAMTTVGWAVSGFASDANSIAEPFAWKDMDYTGDYHWSGCVGCTDTAYTNLGGD